MLAQFLLDFIRQPRHHAKIKRRWNPYMFNLVAPCQLFGLAVNIPLVFDLNFHLLGNLYFLYVFGDNVEHLFGRRRFLLLYLGGALVGGLRAGAGELRAGEPAAGTMLGVPQA